MSSIKKIDPHTAREMREQGMSAAKVAAHFGAAESSVTSVMMQGLGRLHPKDKCQICGATSKLARHHTSYKENTIMILCRRCHSKAHTWSGFFGPKARPGLNGECSSTLIMAQMFYVYRCKHKLSLREMGELVGVHYTAIMRFEKGETVSMDNFIKMLAWVFQ